MTPIQRTLWDLITPRARPVARAPKPATPRTARKGPMAERYERVTREMLETHAVRVHKWRSSMSGVAWQITYKDGSVSRLIEAPRPRGPMSAAVFLHEIGHHAIGFGTYTPRCLEEYHAWKFALDTMREQGLHVTDRVLARERESVAYAIEKALRRGLKRLPSELTPYLERAEARRHSVR